MSDDFGIPVGQQYVCALGRAVYNFAYLEVNVIMVMDRLEPGYAHVAGKKTAKQLANNFKAMTVRWGSGSGAAQQELATLAATFVELVRRRDQLFHAKPYTAAGGEQRLGYYGRHANADWPETDILAAARDFERAAIEANNLYYQHLLPQQDPSS